MNDIAVFQGISSRELERLTECFKPVIRQFAAGETIMQRSYAEKSLGILLAGNAHMYCFDAEGSSGLIESYTENAVFGSFFMLPIEDFDYLIVADSPCRVMFLDYEHIIHPCESACSHHSQLINNIILMTAQKVRLLTLRINIISQKTVRQKLMAYLEYHSLLNESRSFTIPMSLVKLAEYLCVDRSAVMKELQSLRKEGVLESHGRAFRLLEEDGKGARRHDDMRDNIRA